MQNSWPKALSLIACLALLFLLCTALVSACDYGPDFSGVRPFLRLPVVLCSDGDIDAGDRDGDGISELLVPARGANGSSVPGQLLWVISGRDGAVLRRFPHGTESEGLPWAGSVALLRGEGSTGALYAVGGGSCLLVFAGRDGRLAWSWREGGGEEARVWAVRGAGDVDGDSCGDLWLAAGSADDRARVLLLSGSDGSLLLEPPMPEGWASFGQHLAVCEDLDGDGIGEILANGMQVDGAWAVACLSGRTGRRLHSAELLSQQGSDPWPLGNAIQVIEDRDRDGIRDIFIATEPQAFVLSGGTGAVVERIDVGEHLGAVWLGDWTGDGEPELALKVAGGRVPRRPGDGFFDRIYYMGFEILSIRSAEVLARIRIPWPFCTASRCPDLDGDGLDDVAVRVGGAVGTVIYGSSSFR